MDTSRRAADVERLTGVLFHVHALDLDTELLDSIFGLDFEV